MKRLALAVLALTLLVGTAMAQHAPSITTESLTLVDRTRHREIPVTLYYDQSSIKTRLTPVVISHGYGGKSTDYSFIALYLAARGHYVASIQQELPSDPPLPSAGRPYDDRMPSWQRGVQNILFLIAELKQRHPGFAYDSLLLIGHSHGGDTSMLLAREHPDVARTVISLDSRRMPFPRTRRPRVLTLRSSDQRPDDGVLPSVEEQAALGMTVVQLPATVHNDMWDGATQQQQEEMLSHIARFLSIEP